MNGGLWLCWIRSAQELRVLAAPDVTGLVPKSRMRVAAPSAAPGSRTLALPTGGSGMNMVAEPRVHVCVGLAFSDGLRTRRPTPSTDGAPRLSMC
jgi:hypothetical protein